MDSLNMTNRIQIHEIHKMVIKEEIFIVRITVLKSNDSLGDLSWQQMQHSSIIYLQNGASSAPQKTRGQGVNTTIDMFIGNQ